MEIVEVILGILGLFAATHHEEVKSWIDCIRGKKKSRSDSETMTEEAEKPNLISREDVLQEIIKHYNKKKRLVTVYGFGGLGKTSIARLFYSSFHEYFPESRVKFVELESHNTIIGLCHEVHKSLTDKGISDNDTTAEAKILKLLKKQKNLFLILDNFEQLRDLKDKTIGQWLEKSKVNILVTSIEPLCLNKEESLKVPKLTVPRSSKPSEVKKSYSFKLFQKSLADSGIISKFKLKDYQILSEILRELDGIPLAIVIVAPYLQSVALKDLKSALHELENPDKGRPERHSSMDKVFDWTFKVLNDNEKHVLMQSAVFSVPFSLTVANEVIVGDRNASLASTLRRLQKKNWIKVTDDEEKRNYLLPVVKRFLKRRMLSDMTPDEIENLHMRWADFFVGYGEKWNSKIHLPEEGKTALDKLSMEMENFFDIQNYFLEREPELAARAILAFSETMGIRGPFEHRETKIANSYNGLSNKSVLLKSKLQVELSKCHWIAGQWIKAYDIAQKAVSRAESVDNQAILLSALYHLGRIKSDLGQYKDALKDFRKILRLAEENSIKAITCNNIAHCEEKLGDLDAANRSFQQALVSAKDDKIIQIDIFNKQSLAHWHHGRLEKGLELIKRAQEISAEVKHEAMKPAHLTNEGLIKIDMGKFEEAIALFEKAASLHERKQWKAVNSGAWGRALLRQGLAENFFEAEKKLDEGLNGALKVNYPETIASYLGDLSQINFNNNNLGNYSAG